MTMTMTEMLEATFARREELQKDSEYEIWSCGKAFDIDGVGTVRCAIQIARGATTWMRPHFRRNWELNGKRISASKLKEIVGA